MKYEADVNKEKKNIAMDVASMFGSGQTVKSQKTQQHFFDHVYVEPVGVFDFFNRAIKNVEGKTDFIMIGGEIGNGKSTAIKKMMIDAVNNNFIVCGAMLGRDVNFADSGGCSDKLYRNLVADMKVPRKTRKSDGSLKIGGLSDLLGDVRVTIKEIEEKNTLENVELSRSDIIRNKILDKIEARNGGSNFAAAIKGYIMAKEDVAAEKKGKSENDRKTDIKNWLKGVSQDGVGKNIKISGPNKQGQCLFDYMALFSELAIFCGYRGLVVFIDELHGLEKCNSNAKKENVQRIKEIVYGNETSTTTMLFVFSGTHQSIEGENAGCLFSEASLKSRIANSPKFLKMSNPSRSDLDLFSKRAAGLWLEAYGDNFTGPDDDQIRLLIESSISKMSGNSSGVWRDFMKDLGLILNKDVVGWQGGETSRPLGSDLEARPVLEELGTQDSAAPDVVDGFDI